MHEDVRRLNNLRQDMFADPECATKGACQSYPWNPSIKDMFLECHLENSRSKTIDEGEPFNTVSAYRGRREKTNACHQLTRIKRRFFKHKRSMSKQKSKRQSKLSIRLKAGREAEFDMMVALSGKNKNEYVNDLIYNQSRHDLAELKFRAQCISELQQIKAEVQRQGLMSEDIARELKLLRTIHMNAMGRKS